MKSKLTALVDGPLQLVSDKQILFKDGVEVAAGQKVLLCTCGQFGTKQVCAVSDVEADFSGAREIEEEILQEYPGREITVYFNRSICSGAAN